LNALLHTYVRVLMVGLRMLPLLRSDPLLPEFPPFMLDMLEVVDSTVESPKCLGTKIRQKPKAPVQNRRNWAVQF
jgi:hypothetical protein